MRKIQLVILLVVVLGLLSSCGLLNGDRSDDDIPSLPLPVYPQPYAQPSVSPDGTKMLFVHFKITHLTSMGSYTIHPDSSGIWIADIDGANMKLLIHGHSVGTPSFSPDMNWVLFESGAQIYKAPFNGDSVTMDSLIQLTTEGRNFFPNWSPDGQWIVYNQSVCNEIKQCGVWLYNLETETEQFISEYGSYPHWHPTKNSIIYLIGDSLWTYTLNSSKANFLAFLEGDNGYPKYSPNGNFITFQSNIEIKTIDSKGENPRLLTNDGGLEPTWTPNGDIIYVKYVFETPEVVSNGTLWIMNADGSGKRQLTFNYGLEVAY